jgi:hypothetical protein
VSNPALGKAGESDRNETRTERLDRHWAELLQELRVMQTGTQLIAGFLLTLPFSERFTELGDAEELLYLALVVDAAVTTAVMLAPIALHRRLYGGKVRDRLVRVTHRLVAVALVGIGLLLTGIVALVFSFVAGSTSALVATGAVAVTVVALLVALPMAVHLRD